MFSGGPGRNSRLVDLDTPSHVAGRRYCWEPRRHSFGKKAGTPFYLLYAAKRMIPRAPQTARAWMRFARRCKVTTMRLRVKGTIKWYQTFFCNFYNFFLQQTFLATTNVNFTTQQTFFTNVNLQRPDDPTLNTNSNVLPRATSNVTLQRTCGRRATPNVRW